MHEKGFSTSILLIQIPEDHLFPHNGLRANIFSTLDAGPSYSIQNPLTDSDCCDKQQPRNNSREAFWINESKYL
jgi:hypothetical protein